MPDIFSRYSLIWLLVIFWLIIGIVWQFRFKKLISRLFNLTTKPVVFINDKEPNSVPYYPRIALELLVNNIRERFAKNYIVLILGYSIPFFIDIVFRIIYIAIDVIQYFITAPIFAFVYSFSTVTGSISAKESSAPGNNRRISIIASILYGLLGKYKHEVPENLKLSVAYPKLLSKRFPSIFKIIIYPLRESKKLETLIKQEIENANITNYSGNTNLISGNFVVIELLSQDIEFTKAVTKRLSDGINDISFTGKPKDTAFVGEHRIKLSVTDKETNHEYVSLIFKVKIVDFAFDHVSRPFLSKLTSFILGLASVITYTLTLIGKIDGTFGLASGTIAALIATFVYGRSYLLFSQPRENANITSK
jgi:hypothetical protein